MYEENDEKLVKRITNDLINLESEISLSLDVIDRSEDIDEKIEEIQVLKSTLENVLERIKGLFNE